MYPPGIWPPPLAFAHSRVTVGLFFLSVPRFLYAIETAGYLL